LILINTFDNNCKLIFYLYSITYTQYNNIADISFKLEKNGKTFIFDLRLQQYDISHGPHFVGFSQIIGQHKFFL
jgi:hypothetical protein